MSDSNSSHHPMGASWSSYSTGFSPFFLLFSKIKISFFKTSEYSSYKKSRERPRTSYHLNTSSWHYYMTILNLFIPLRVLGGWFLWLLLTHTFLLSICVRKDHGNISSPFTTRIPSLFSIFKNQKLILKTFLYIHGSRLISIPFITNILIKWNKQP